MRGKEIITQDPNPILCHTKGVMSDHVIGAEVEVEVEAEKATMPTK